MARPRRLVLWFLLFAVVLLLLAYSLHFAPFSACECETDHHRRHHHHPPGPHHRRHYDPITPKPDKADLEPAELDPFRVPWGTFVSQPSGRRVQVISVSQDHRPLPTTPSLPAHLRSRTFHHLATTTPPTDGNHLLHIFQIHLALNSTFFDIEGDIETPTAYTFQTVELWWPSQAGDGGGEDDGAGGPVKKLTAQAITLDEPLNAAYRYKVARPQYLELIVRCAFLLSDDAADELLRRRREVRFAVFAAREVAFFPLDHVLHFPRATSLLPIAPTETGARDCHHRLATAPWANSSSGVASIVRASGADARVRVGAWITKKFTWTDDDELWLLWTLDVVGVDHVVLHLATRQLSLESMRQRLARHPGVLERVTLVGVDAPGRDDRVTYCYLQELLVWDGFVRWQADFDFVFLVDTDEFVQLFEREAPHRRIDAKTFIARNRERLQTGGHAYMNRLRVGRTQDHSTAEAQLPAFLNGMADFDFVFLVDTDEFVQLFEREAPHRRIDAKTFIARNRERLQTGGHAYMNRLRVGRTQDHSTAEAQLPAFLNGMVSLDGAQIQELTDAGSGGWESQGKSLFFANGAVQPYLHWSVGYPKDKWAVEEAHILHVRKSAHHDWANGPLTWWLHHLRGR
ncbi:uncharacterized protein ACA1_095420 [Acanthamoeba castellanii str. Neff]|uniref:Glycosyltransferase family 92 protein n=1 Tax=Acanthamoeba castellanii (strain ATCC 30010 / Neff) TaxID=1257118 RepID=L8GIS4_ACACF|nr:uncharacterized protein ACA1_095420 [Acanthamoeba castellanii str. Neff]ELR12902.1 hypothetical protein ACA1_095420 [Acanthamoeba castellanii str. Neff]